jgi:hypothetical protein
MNAILKDLQRQLVDASRSLSQAQPTLSHRMPRRSQAFRRCALVVGGVLAVTGTAVAAATQLSSDRDESIDVVQRLATMPDGPSHRYVRANGLDPSRATLAFVTSDRLEVYVVRDAHATCIMISDGDDQCYRATAARSGLSVSVASECTVGTDRRMRIAGTAPTGARRVHVAYSSGAGHSADVTSGVFVIDNTTPSQGDPYPVGLEALDADGATMTSKAIPYGRNLCLGR